MRCCETAPRSGRLSSSDHETGGRTELPSGSDAPGGSGRRRRFCRMRPRADCGFNHAALHPADPIECRPSTQRTQAPERVETTLKTELPPLDPLENNIGANRKIAVRLASTPEADVQWRRLLSQFDPKCTAQRHGKRLLVEKRPSRARIWDRGLRELSAWLSVPTNEARHRALLLSRSLYRRSRPVTPASTATDRRSVTAHSTPTRASGRTTMSSREKGSDDALAPKLSFSCVANAPALA
jgi:hypothetical protein